MREIEEAQAALKREETRIKYLEEQADVSSWSSTRCRLQVSATYKQQTSWFQVFSSAPERKVYFGGKTVEANAPIFEMESQIVYPMLGGTVLITFEEEDGEFEVDAMSDEVKDQTGPS